MRDKNYILNYKEIIGRGDNLRYALIICSTLFLLACSPNPEEESIPNNNDDDKQIEQEEEQKDDTIETEAIEQEKEDIGSEVEKDIELHGEVTYEDQTIDLNLETNLHKEATLFIRPMPIDGSIFMNVSRSKALDDHGNLETDINLPDAYDKDVILEIRFRPEDEDEDIQVIYGEEGEKLSGDFVQVYESYDSFKKEIRTTLFIPQGENRTIETPTWKERDDLGDPNIEIDAQARIEDDIIHITGDSNFLPGMDISIKLLDEDQRVIRGIIPTVIRSDGSFENWYDVEDYIDDVAGFRISLHFSHFSNESIIEQYGEDGEKINSPYFENGQFQKEFMFR